MGSHWFDSVYRQAQIIAKAGSEPDVVTEAIGRACTRFGGEGGTFNAANFSATYCELSGIHESLDGGVVRSILRKRDDVHQLPGGAHFRYAGTKGDSNV
jgi:hypothetical protein